MYITTLQAGCHKKTKREKKFPLDYVALHCNNEVLERDAKRRSGKKWRKRNKLINRKKIGESDV